MGDTSISTRKRFYPMDSSRGGGNGGGPYYKRRRGQWGHSRRSINAALAISPSTTTDGGAVGGGAGTTSSTTLATTNSSSGANPSTSNLTTNISNPTNNESGGSRSNTIMHNNSDGVDGKPKGHRHGRKRRRHRHSSFSGGGGSGEKSGGSGGGGGGSSAYHLPPAVAAALAIPPKTPDVNDMEIGNALDTAPNPNASSTTTTTATNQNNGGPMHDQQLPSSSTQQQHGSTSTSANSMKKKRRPRRKRRQWKPYYKLTAEERQELEIREEKRAERVRAQRFAHGQPVAPYNTTQFLLRDRELRNGGEPDCGDLDEIVRNIRHHTRSGSYESPPNAAAMAANHSDNSDDTSESDYSYLDREFDNDWLDEQRQRLETMTKNDLVKEFMDLQKQYEYAQRDMRAKRLAYEEQIGTLRRENQLLRASASSPSSSAINTSHPSSNDVLVAKEVQSGNVIGISSEVNHERSDIALESQTSQIKTETPTVDTSTSPAETVITVKFQ